jgi:hypothetical protein
MFRVRFSALALAGICFSIGYHTEAASFQEDFSSNPAARGWQAVGNTNLFHWNSNNQNLDVTWNSSQPNSYYCRSLGTIVTTNDDFSVAFDLQLSEIAAGFDPQKTGPFGLSIGFLNLAVASGTNFLRGTGSDSPMLAEFSFFPDPGGSWIYGPSLTTVMIDSSGTNWSSGGFSGDTLTSNDEFHITLTFTASNQTFRTVILSNGVPYSSPSDAHPVPGFQDFRLDHFSISSYSDAGQDPFFAGSLYARGTVANVSVTTPPAPISNITGGFSNGVWRVTLNSRANWFYTLERSTDLHTWAATGAGVPGNGGTLVLQDPGAPGGGATYRVRAARP